MRRWASGIVSGGFAVGLLWILWKIKPALPGNMETVIIGAIVGTALIILIAFSGDRYDEPVSRGRPMGG